MTETIIAKTFDEERALYHIQDALIKKCTFAGAADGESVLKEARNITVEHCSFSLRYPLWHVRNFTLKDSVLEEPSRAPMWYCFDGEMVNTKIRSVKAVRECHNIKITDSDIISPEFGWKNDGMEVQNTSITSEYVFFGSKNVHIKNLHLSGKYSFQYMENLTIEDSVLDTKDAFWHSKNITVKNSVVKGEYLAWFSEGLTLMNCKIIGTQPLCYCKDLKLIDCTMEGCDLSFEYSDVQASVIGHIDSVKNPRSGEITCDSVGEIIREEPVYECNGKIQIR